METPFRDGGLIILDVHYGNGGIDAKYFKEKIGFKIQQKYDRDCDELLVRLFSKKRSAIYSIVFKGTVAFRVLDEDSLLQIWEETRKQGGRLGLSTFKIRNHLWAGESPLAFDRVPDSWSFVIATDETCVEAVCSNVPDIRFEEAVRSYRLE